MCSGAGGRSPADQPAPVAFSFRLAGAGRFVSPLLALHVYVPIHTCMYACLCSMLFVVYFDGVESICMVRHPTHAHSLTHTPPQHAEPYSLVFLS
jgi:hypothetical protein